MRRVWLSFQALAAMIAEGHRCEPLETGGALIGYWASSDEAVITCIVGPGPAAEHELTAFTPDHGFHQNEIDRIYRATGRTETYLGDWHTHPRNGACLSDKDIRTLKKIAHHQPSRLAHPLMAVLALEKAELVVWCCVEHKRLQPWSGRVVSCTLDFFDIADS